MKYNTTCLNIILIVMENTIMIDISKIILIIMYNTV